ncbi:GWxTD domain-containing protein [Hymenobacter sp. BT770]|uniref:GWxTD domain-containing protein n=1 Tax=Hymenobacter sp. BT770 TaxID=2886942 RepID=UPI001D126A8B|nr:GWxTD domain-containing protein [Hymenobacter sp. BT770]MCC3153317.1 GWxTD domain-containing protein [Hymenobacter sp. BT770]MDO3414312.1 GWxTD domain-containing protein [Hymenobacter sp. BT770]
MLAHSRYWLCLAWLLPLHCAFAPLAQRPDYAGLYRDGPHLDVDTRREGDSLRFYLRLPAPTRLGPGHPLRLAVWPSYEARQPLWQDSIPRRQQHPRLTAEGTRLTFCVLTARVPTGAIVELRTTPVDTKDDYQDPSTTAWLRLSEAQLARPFVLTDSVGLPLLRRYVRAGEAFGVDSYGLYQPVRWKRYEVMPVAALPPMTNPAALPAGPRVLPVLDSAEARPGELLHFATPGLYALHVGAAGSAPGRTLAVMVAANNYPALTTAAELIEPLRYLTTSLERKRLTEAPDPKRAVDKFWLDIAQGNQTLGKDLIRRYYGRVTAANHLFAAHKAGWLTDRGLLYIVLGPPPSVRRLFNGEERWFYPEGSLGGGPISYTFRPRPSTFAPDYYELVRRPEYELLWYAAVEKWRTPPTALTGPNVPTDR